MMGPGWDGPPGDVEPQGPLGPNALMEMDSASRGGVVEDKIPDNVTFKEFYCTICKKQTENWEDFEAHNKSEEHLINEANVETFTCRLCRVNLTSTADYNMHLEAPNHILNQEAKNQRDHLRAMGQFVPDSEDEDEEEDQFYPEPLSDEGSKQRLRTHPWHCGTCNVWFETITILKFYHSVSPEHLSMAKSLQLSGNPTCLICKASGETSSEMLEKCCEKQRARILGPHRQFSCDMCDVHLSEQEWLDNHNGGEKHRWTAERVEKLLPVQYKPIDMHVVPKTRFNPYTGMPDFWEEFRCVVCKVGFTPIDRYKKHINSLFHLRRCAGEDVKWVDNGMN